MDYLSVATAHEHEVSDVDCGMPVDWMNPGAEATAVFAHEIRTPLATINATLELLSYDPSLELESVQQLVGRLHRGVSWITNLVDNLNTWTAMRDRTLQLQHAQAVVREWIERPVALVQPILEQREQKVLLACPNPSPVVVGDAFLLSQVIANLLTNASRYGAQGDTIAITVIEEHDAVEVHVADHGPGIPADECAKIFGPGVRGSRALATCQGQGLGLSIVAGIIRLHGGKVEVDSVLGRGTTFRLRLPVGLSI